MSTIKKRDGFEGEKLINIPPLILKNTIKENAVMGQLYVAQIGYFPKASYHFRERKNGCPENILIYCVRGKGWYIINKQRYEVGVNEFILLPANKEYMRYGADETDPWTIYWVHFTGKDMPLFNKGFNINLGDGPQQIIFNKKGIDIWESMYQNLEMGFSKNNIIKTNLSLYHLLATFLYPEKYLDEKKQDTGNMINETVLYMRSELTQQLTLHQMAVQNNMSASHFSNLFKKATGMSPLDYFIHLKLQKACILLYSSDIKIKNVAEAIGYGDPYYFSRLFKKYMTVSPEKYRTMQRKKNE